MAGLCAEWRLDAQAIMAALMHDAMEDCGITKVELIERFGAPPAELVDGLTYELAQKLIDDDVPVILHSDRARAEDIAARFPRATTVAKPCPPADLLGAVSRVLAPCCDPV